MGARKHRPGKELTGRADQSNQHPLDKGLADEIAAIARVSDVSVSEAIREAISEHIAERRTHPEFQKRLKDRVEADRQMFEHLAG